MWVAETTCEKHCTTERKGTVFAQDRTTVALLIVQNVIADSWHRRQRSCPFRHATDFYMQPRLVAGIRANPTLSIGVMWQRNPQEWPCSVEMSVNAIIAV